jgi:hypothetical protein
MLAQSEGIMTRIKRVFQVDGKPFFPLGGQVHNSSGYNLAEMETAFKVLNLMDANTVEVPVYWSQVEPEEGLFHFAVLDDLLAGCREHGLKLMLLWFGTWKNGQMEYAPGWVKSDQRRFRRVETPGGFTIPVLSSQFEENRRADERAFGALMRAVREKDADQKTIIAVQVENEPGILGCDRDYGAESTATFHSPVPPELIEQVAAHPDTPVAAAWQGAGSLRSGTWPELFGWQAGEFMTAWQIAHYIDSLAAAGKAIYDIPMTINVWLGDGGHRLAGMYPSGGAVTRVLDVFKWNTPHIDIVAPDIYAASSAGYRFECEQYARPDNPLFVPESGPAGSNARNMFYALGTYDAIGYFCFGIESMLDEEGAIRAGSREVIESFRVARRALPLLLAHQGTDRVYTVVQEEHAGDQTIDMGDYIAWVRYADSDQRYPRGFLYPRGGGPNGFDRARGLIIRTGEREFYLAGGPFRVIFKRKPAPEDELTPAMAAALLNEDLPDFHMVEEGAFDEEGQWHARHWRNGDEVTGGLWVDVRSGLVRAVLTA